MATLPPQSIAALKEFTSLLKSQPDLLHSKELDFFKDYLESLGASIPAPSAPGAVPSEGSKPTEANTTSKEEEEEEEDPLPADDGLMEPDEDMGLAEGDPDSMPDDDEMEHATNCKMAASEAMSNADFETAVLKYTEAIKLMPSALIYANRAACLLKMKKPNNAVKDCDKALEINPDSGKAYKIRGKAYRFLGQYEKSYKDLGKGQNIDYDEDTYEMQVTVKPFMTAALERQRKKEAREKAWRIQQAQKAREEASAAAASSAMPGMGGFPGMGGMGGMGGMPGGMPGMGGGGLPAGVTPEMLQAVMGNPELMAAMQKPGVMAAMQDVMQNPANMAKYANDPEMMNLFAKFQQSFGGGGMPGM